jgi:hypothetical protein
MRERKGRRRQRLRERERERRGQGEGERRRNMVTPTRLRLRILRLGQQAPLPSPSQLSAPTTPPPSTSNGLISGLPPSLSTPPPARSANESTTPCPQPTPSAFTPAFLGASPPSLHNSAPAAPTAHGLVRLRRVRNSPTFLPRLPSLFLSTCHSLLHFWHRRSRSLCSPHRPLAHPPHSVLYHGHRLLSALSLRGPHSRRRRQGEVEEGCQVVSSGSGVGELHY